MLTFPILSTFAGLRVVCAHFDPLLLSHSRLFYAITVTLDSLIQVTRGGGLENAKAGARMLNRKRKREKISNHDGRLPRYRAVTRVERSVAGEDQTSGSISSRTLLVHALDPPRSVQNEQKPLPGSTTSR